MFLLMIFTYVVLLQFSKTTTAQQNPTLNYCTNYASSSTSYLQFQTNLNLLNSSLVSNGSVNGFFNASFDVRNPNSSVYGLVQCKGGISMGECRTCLQTAGENIIKQCANGKSAFIRYENCLFRYAGDNFFSQAKTSPINLMPGVDDASNVDVFSKNVEGLMNGLTANAASSASKFQFGLANDDTNSLDIYGLAQCTRDLSEKDCLSCLRRMTDTVYVSCRGKKGCQAICASCVVRYEVGEFFDTSLLPPFPPPPPTSSPPPNPTGGKSSMIVVKIVVPVAVGLVLLSAFFGYLSWRKLTNKGSNNSGNNNIESEKYSLQFALRTIRSATRDFADANKLGKGGFGVVYKGVLPNGQKVAVKRLSQSSGQGSEEFKNEVMLLHKLQHRNLVKLLGFCFEGQEKLLIYEFVPNGSLDKYLFDPTNKACLDWERRYNIIKGIARGMLYLHEESRLRIIHRDLKASNILLGDGMNSQISDFGMARLFGVDQTHQETKKVAGTFGYMAPEYVVNGMISMKSDVYSFGVLVLEILSGQQIINENREDSPKVLTSIAWEHWREGTASQFLDPCLSTGSSDEVIMKCLHIGLLCIQMNVEDRPTMASVMLMLDSDSLTLAIPSPPPFWESENLSVVRSGSATSN
ncbi:hypothetical protein Sjap_003368 [Stephania japonica]|uniref:Cysteine-rich receptor-like protein kinase 10 n=1 Tax=Stephania japonica TaxID=461633 RepID=A0AAP0PTH0_9MAGN